MSKIYLIDRGDDYHQMIVYAICGNTDPRAILEAYEKKHQAYIKEYRALEIKAVKVIGKQPQLYNSSSGNIDEVTARFKKDYSNHVFKLKNYMDKHLTNKAPYLKQELTDAGFELRDFEVLRAT